MTLTPNPYWYGEQPKLQKLVLKMIGDPNAAYLNDELDVVTVSATPSTPALVANRCAFREEKRAGPLHGGRLDSAGVV